MAFRRALAGRLIFSYPLPRSSVSATLPAKRLPFRSGVDQLLDSKVRLVGQSPRPPREPKDLVGGFTVAEARKVLRAAQLEAARARLRGLGRGCVSYEEFVGICSEIPGVESGAGLARALPESGAVIIFGNVVFLRPEMVAEAIESMIPASLAEERDPQRKELKEMEEKKAWIDGRAEALARRELRWGLCFLVVQTAGFARLTFWELSWDVMEPICCYVASAYFMLGYVFFLRTSRDPSFEGVLRGRFAAKQKRLMKTHNFDIDRFEELRKALSSSSSRHCCAPVVKEAPHSGT